MSHRKTRISFWLARLMFAGVIIVEGLNWGGILHGQLDFTWGGLMLTAVSVWAGVEAIHYWLRRRTGFGLPWFSVLLAVASLYIDAFGDMLHGYSSFWWYDQMAHLVGGSAVGLVLAAVSWRLTAAGKNWDWVVSFCIVFGTAFFASLYEIEEYLEDRLTGSRRLGDGFDTADDMMWGIVGGILVAFIAQSMSRMLNRKTKI